MTIGIAKSKIARIWETPEGFVVTEFDNYRILGTYASDAEAGERTRALGFEEIFWEDVDAQPTTPEATTPTSEIARIWKRDGGLVVTDWRGVRVSQIIFPSDGDAGEFAYSMGFDEIIWEEAEMPPAEAEYLMVFGEVENLLGEARRLIYEHAARVVEDCRMAPDWEHVGDMKHARQLIKQLVAFLSPDGE